MSKTITYLMNFAGKLDLAPQRIGKYSFHVRSLKSNSVDDPYPGILVKQEADTILYLVKLTEYSKLSNEQQRELFEELLSRHFNAESFVHYSINQESKWVYLQVVMPNTGEEETDCHFFVIAHTNLVSALKLYDLGSDNLPGA